MKHHQYSLNLHLSIFSSSEKVLHTPAGGYTCLYNNSLPKLLLSEGEEILLGSF